MVNSIRKGKRFEREIAKLLSFTSKTPWKRVPNSGGLAGSHDSQVFQGDLYSERHPDITVECKNWKQLSLTSLFTNKGLFRKAVQQTIKESKGNHWLLFIKPNNKGVFMVFHKDSMKKVQELRFTKGDGEIIVDWRYVIWKVT